MNYKKVFKNPRTISAIVNAFGWLPDSVALPIQYRIKMSRHLHLRNPRRWTEKLQVYKMRYRNPRMAQCVDKYEVRKYVESKGLSDCLVKLYGIWDDPRDVDFNKLPDSFVFKLTSGGGGLNVDIVGDKSLYDLDSMVSRYIPWVGPRKRKHSLGREWAYEGISRARVIAEERLVNSINPQAGIEDFKILCFNGTPKYIIVDKDRYVDHKRNFYDTDWERISVTTDHEQFETPYPRPANLDRMLEVAETLSKDFPFVRVDLYNVAGKVYFGELTFYPWSGYVQFDPDQFDFVLGDLFDTTTL